MARIDDARETATGDLLDGKVQSEESGAKTAALDLAALDPILTGVLKDVVAKNVFALVQKWRHYTVPASEELCESAGRELNKILTKFLGDVLGNWVASNPDAIGFITLFVLWIGENEVSLLAISGLTADKDNRDSRVNGLGQNQPASGVAQAA